MEIRKLNTDIAYVSKLDDYPNDVGGMSSDELKATFDKAGQDIQRYINDELVPDIKSYVSEAQLGLEEVGTLNGTVLSEGSVTGEKLAYKTVTQDKIGEKAVGTTELADSAVTEDKIGLRAVSSTRIAQKAIGGEHIGDSAVQTAAIRDGAVTNTKVAPNAISQDKLAKGATHKVMSAVLPLSGWVNNKQEVEVKGVSALETNIVSPAAYSHVAWCEAGVYCSGERTDYLTFTCTNVPESALNAVITVLR